MKEIKFNSYGETTNKEDYLYLYNLFKKKNINTEERKTLNNKIICYCGLIISISGLKQHIKLSKTHKKRMSVFNLDNTCYYIHPYNPNSKKKNIEKIIKTEEKIVIKFD